MNGERKISIIIPIIRPEKAERCIAALENDLSFQEFEIVTAIDDNRIGCPRMVKDLVNKTRYDLVCFLGDDTIPQPGMLRNALDAMGTLPDGWGMVGINDNVRAPHTDNPVAHWLADKRLLAFLGGEFFHTGYVHCWCDNELTDRAKALGRYVFAEDARLTHDHPILNPDADDADYRRVYLPMNYTHDLRLYRRRKRNKWMM